jgi:hypothetical protein
MKECLRLIWCFLMLNLPLTIAGATLIVYGICKRIGVFDE